MKESQTSRKINCSIRIIQNSSLYVL